MSCLIHEEKTIGVEDNLPDAYLSNIEMIPRWSEELVSLLTIGQIDVPIPLREKKAMIQKTTSFVMRVGRMYNKGLDRILIWCIELEEKNHYLKLAHETIGGIHMAGNQTVRRLL